MSSAMRAQYAVLWDVDGVIIDSAEQHRAAWEALARQEGLSYSDEAFWPTFGMRNADVIPRLYQVAEPPERVVSLGERKEAIYRGLLAQEARALPGAKELMAALHAAGYRQAVGSSAPERNITLIVALLGLGQWLEATVSGESVAHGKPAPDIFLAGAERLGVAPERCLVIEDAVAGIQAAHAGGMRCLAVRRAGQADALGLNAAEYIADALTDVDVALVDRLLGVAQ